MHFAWTKAIHRMRQTVFRGMPRVDQQFKLTLTASTLMRLVRMPMVCRRRSHHELPNLRQVRWQVEARPTRMPRRTARCSRSRHEKTFIIVPAALFNSLLAESVCEQMPGKSVH